MKLRENGRIFRTYLDWDTGWRKSNGSDRNFVVECWDISFGDSCRGGRNVPGSEKERSRELKKISDTVQRMTSGKELPDFSDCEETMDSKIRHQLLRLQEILVSQKQDAQKERKELQELISEIAHQMRTPLTNLKNYLDFLSEEIEKKGTEPELSYLKAIQSSEEKIYFLTEHFIRISRLEHGLIQIRKEERDLLKTLRNALGQILDQAEKKRNPVRV